MLKTAVLLLLLSVVLFTGCGSDDEALIGIHLVQPTYTLDNIVITAKDRFITHTLNEDDFNLNGATYNSKKIRTMKSGELELDFAIYDGTSRQVEPDVEGTITLDLKPDWAWSVDFVISDMNPFNYCMGCSGYESYVLPETLKRNENDTLFVIWGGNSIKHPVIY